MRVDLPDHPLTHPPARPQEFMVQESKEASLQKENLEDDFNAGYV